MIVKIPIKVNGQTEQVDFDTVEMKNKLMERGCNNDEIQKILIYLITKII